MPDLPLGSAVDHPSLNPYAPPCEPGAGAVTPRRAQPWKAFGRWTLICTVSAAPSFFWGCALHAEPVHLLAMTSGIFVFIVAYTVVECSSFYQQVMTLPDWRRTALIGYGTRVLISIVLPIGATLDMFVGAFSMSLVESLSLFQASERPPFLQVFITTLVQGVLLNIVLLAYMTGVYGILRLFAALQRRVELRT